MNTLTTLETKQVDPQKKQNRLSWKVLGGLFVIVWTLQAIVTGQWLIPDLGWLVIDIFLALACAGFVKQSEEQDSPRYVGGY